MSSPVKQAIQQICDEKNIPYEVVMETIEAALAAAYRKDFGEKNQNIKVEFDPETMATRAFDEKIVVEDQELPTEEELEALKEAPLAEPELDENGEPVKKFNPKTEIMISEAKEIKPDAELEDILRKELEVPGEFGRMAAQTAKQVIIQKLREAERENVFTEYKDREGEIVTGIVQRREGRTVLIDLGSTTAVMPSEEQIFSESYNPGSRIKVFVVSVTKTTRGPVVVVSRSHPDIVRKLFIMEIPEVANGSVEIHSVAREAGSRSKIAVSSNDVNIDPIGSCIGQRGVRIQTVITELGGEKVDVIQFTDDPVDFITNALSPAKVSSVELNEEERVATVFTDADQLSLAIGKSGQNVRLASKLSGWKINVVEAGIDPNAESTEDGSESSDNEDEDKTESVETAVSADEPKEEGSEEGSKDETKDVIPESVTDIRDPETEKEKVDEASVEGSEEELQDEPKEEGSEDAPKGSETSSEDGGSDEEDKK